MFIVQGSRPFWVWVELWIWAKFGPSQENPMDQVESDFILQIWAELSQTFNEDLMSRAKFQVWAHPLAGPRSSIIFCYRFYSTKNVDWNCWRKCSLLIFLNFFCTSYTTSGSKYILILWNCMILLFQPQNRWRGGFWITRSLWFKDLQ